ncbi:MAG: DUF692 family multinuclear iron-containing protein [Chloroflexota bacterium]
MIRLSVNYSIALTNLIQNNSVHVDAVEVVQKLSPAKIKHALDSLPSIPFHFHAGRFGLQPVTRPTLRHYLQLCPQSPFISLHLALLPPLSLALAFHSHIYLPAPNPDHLLKTFIRQIKRLKTQADRPVILENMPTLHPQKYRFETEPACIVRVLDETDCPMLLDIAHARVAANARGCTAEEYITALPLERVRQVHISGPRQCNGMLFDAHQSLQEEDYSLLAWVLERVQPTWLTLEYFREEIDTLREQLLHLQALI